jgi:hypothetical protein
MSSFGVTRGAGHNQAVAVVDKKAQLTCKDSLLVGWGGATDQYIDNCHIDWACDRGTSAELQGCTLQYHPDSRHSRSFCLVVAVDQSHVSLSHCPLVGPAPGDAVSRGYGICSEDDGTITLVCAGWVDHPPLCSDVVCTVFAMNRAA